MPRRDGFTLIEVLIVLVIIAVLATIGVNRFWAAKDRSLQGVVQSDLRNMASAQEMYFEYNLSYAGAVADLTNYTPSLGVTVNLTYAANDGWAANATHVSLGPTQCGYFTGNAPAAQGAPATVNGIIDCN